MLEFSANGNLDVISLTELADALNGDSRQIQLPSFQRDAVWDEAHIELLWDSLWRGYPVGSLLFADVSELSDDGKLEARPTQVARYEAAGQVSSERSPSRLAFALSRLAIRLACGSISAPERRRFSASAPVRNRGAATPPGHRSKRQSAP